jgi:hypothetical protein
MWVERSRSLPLWKTTPGADEGDQFGRVDFAPAGLRGVDVDELGGVVLVGPPDAG